MTSECAAASAVRDEWSTDHIGRRICSMASSSYVDDLRTDSYRMLLARQEEEEEGLVMWKIVFWRRLNSFFSRMQQICESFCYQRIPAPLLIFCCCCCWFREESPAPHQHGEFPPGAAGMTVIEGRSSLCMLRHFPPAPRLTPLHIWYAETPLPFNRYFFS